jgi:anti-sigma-K factor RskA
VVARVAAAALVVAVGVGATLGRLAAPAPEPEQTVAERAEAALEDPDATVTGLADPVSGMPAARFVVTADGDAYVTLDDLAPLPAERTYQLWRTETMTPVSLGVLGPGRSRAVEVHVPPGQARLAISEEPVGGSPAPTGALVAAGTVR